MTKDQSPSRAGTRRTGARRQEPRLKQDRALRTRRAILKAAAEVFAQRDYPSVTILDIAEQAGVTKGAVYFHFANKEAVAVAVAEQFYTVLLSSLRPVLDTDAAPARKVVELLRRTARSFREDALIQAGSRLQIQQWAIESELPTPYVGFTEILTGLLTECRDGGALPDGSDPEALARVLRSALFGAQHISGVQHGWSDIVERTEEIIQALPFLASAAEDRADSSLPPAQEAI
ncbi:ScbR family autoregulator-binding transcription factor [Streptomyces echinoruber]|uniref:TetR family transcriptional regulator n=1 Tax=Streptomyces echinoruber TaxID=68898 RepID=A0A918RFD8_9ACTN|nr:ScbR family autoregulator-binding transcription factor [Streptomyces echinoruber]GGZ94643.1 TetR family transcriptional regulator [Streptomyces echinoruber]